MPIFAITTVLPVQTPVDNRTAEADKQRVRGLVRALRTRVGHMLVFHDMFKDELPDEEDRVRILEYLREHPSCGVPIQVGILQDLVQSIDQSHPIMDQLTSIARQIGQPHLATVRARGPLVVGASWHPVGAYAPAAIVVLPVVRASLCGRVAGPHWLE